MELYKVRDIVREQIGFGSLSEAALTWCVERGLREIEKSENFYWMEAIKSFSLVINQGEYSVYTSTSSGLNIPGFKDARILLVSDQSVSPYHWDEVRGPESIEDIRTEFASTSTGIPKFFSLGESTTDATLNLYPIDPDKTYSMELHYYQWTSLPTDVTAETHEVLRRWPEALIYLATEQGMILKTKDLQAGSFWRSLYRNVNLRGDDEYKKIWRYHQQRTWATRMSLKPVPGAAPRNRDRFRWSNY